MKYMPFVLISGLMVVSACAVFSSEDWQITIVDNCASETDTSIETNEQNCPNISYRGPDLKYAKLIDGYWQIQTVDCEPYAGFYSSLELDSQGYPHIAYCIYKPSELRHIIKYAWWNGNSWEITAIDGENGNAVDLSLILDSLDRPHISYCEIGKNNLKYAYYDGIDWVIQIVDPYEYVNSFQTSLALDANDNPHIAYSAFTDVAELKYATIDDSQWEIQILDTEVFYCGNPNIKLDSYDFPTVAYINSVDMGDNYMRYAKWTGSNWEIETIEALSFPGTLSLDLDSYNFPHISYFEEMGGSTGLNYLNWNGSSWNLYTIDAGWRGMGSSISIDNLNRPQISYVDGLASLLKYAWFGEPMPGINLLSFTATHKDDSSVFLNWSIETTEGEEIVGFNLYRRPFAEGDDTYHRLDGDMWGEDGAPRLLNEDWNKINPSLITGENPYSYIDDDVDSGMTYEYQLEAVKLCPYTHNLCHPQPLPQPHNWHLHHKHSRIYSCLERN